MNNDIKKYTTPSGKKRYRFAVYAGRNSKNGNPNQIRRQGFKDYDSAKKELERIQNNLAHGKYSADKPQHLKFKEVYEEWFELYASSVKESTFATTKRIVESHILPALGNYYIDQIDIRDCQKAVKQWSKEAPLSYKKYIAYASQIFKYAINLEMIVKNPIENVFRPKVKKSKTEIDYYNKNDLATFLDSAYKFKHEAYTFFFVLAYTGLRGGEALVLQWSDIDFNKKSLTVKRTASKGMQNRNIIQAPKTAKSKRVIFLDDDTLKVLMKWRREQNKVLKVIALDSSNFVFNGWINNCPANVPLSKTAVTVWNAEIAKKAHIRHIRIHDFRHTHASLLFDAGLSMQDVRDRLGHSSIKVTMDIYTHLFQKRRKKNVEKFSEYMEGHK